MCDGCGRRSRPTRAGRGTCAPSGASATGSTHDPARQMIQLALVVAAGSLASGLVLALLLRRAPTVSLQLAGLALIAVCVPLAAVLLSGWVMFHMGADLKILAVAAGSATAAVFAALVLARSITGSLRRVGAASRSLAGGDLSARAPVEGARGIAELAASFHAMATAPEQPLDARRELVARARQVRARPLQPRDERPPPHALGRLGRGPRRAPRLRSAPARRGQRRGLVGRGAGADVRALLAGRPRTKRQRSRPRAGDRPRS